jgi:hypothetical protein
MGLMGLMGLMGEEQPRSIPHLHFRRGRETRAERDIRQAAFRLPNSPPDFTGWESPA